MVWEIVFMLLILKIPVVYLCVVVWYAIQEEPRPGEPVAVAVIEDTPLVGGSSRRRAGRSPRRFGPAGPSRRPRRAARVATSTRAEARP